MSNTNEQLVGQLLIAGFRGKTAETGSNIASLIDRYRISGVILYDEDLEIGGPGSRNIESPDQVKDLTAQLQRLSNQDLFISIDQEGGEVHRFQSQYGFNETPSWNHIGLLNNKLITKEFSDSLASTLSKAASIFLLYF